MKKAIFSLLLILSVACFGLFGQTEDEKRTMEVIPTISAVGGQNGVSLNSELIIAKKFRLSKKLSLYAQAGAMYNLYENNNSTESQLGLEPLVGIGTDNFRISGFLNGLAVKAWDTGTMPFVEGGARLSFVPMKKVWISAYVLFPLSDPVFVLKEKDTYYENEDGVYLSRNEIWAKQVMSYGADVDLGIGKKFVLNLEGFMTENDDYQFSGGLQYRLFKNKPWILGGNVYYTDFKNADYYYVQNVFPGMFDKEMRGYTFRLGISNYGGLANVDFSQMLGRIAEPMKFSPVVKEKVSQDTRIGDKLKFDICNWQGECLNLSGTLCITGGKFPVKVFVDWGDNNSTSFNVMEPGPTQISYSYSKAGTYVVMISAMDSLGKTYTLSREFVAKDCGDDPPPPDPKPCKLCDSIFFHRFSSQVDNFIKELPCSGPLHIPYTIYNKCKTESFKVRIHWDIYMDTDTAHPSYSGEFGIFVPAGADPANFVFDFYPTGAVMTCCYQKLSLYIVGCTKY